MLRAQASAEQCYSQYLSHDLANCRRAVGTSDNLISTSIQCEVIKTADVEIQFANGSDDTEFEKHIARIANQKLFGQSRGNSGSLDAARTDAGDRQAPLIQDDIQLSQAQTQRLPAFVRNVAPVVENLLEQPNDDAEIDKIKQHDRELSSGPFEASSTWRNLDIPMHLLVASVADLHFESCNMIMLACLGV